MKLDEELICSALVTMGFTSISYEPDGNVPPDFLLDGIIAVEARRLTQVHAVGPEGQYRAIDETSIPIWHSAAKFLDKFSDKQIKVSWNVFLTLTGPERRRSVVMDHFKRTILQFLDHNPLLSRRTKLDSAGCLEVTFVPRAQTQKGMFVLAGLFDRMAGGWATDEFAKALKNALIEKNRKIQARRGAYNKWWLVMTDHITYCSDDLNLTKAIKDSKIEFGVFERVILVNPLDPRILVFLEAQRDNGEYKGSPPPSENGEYNG